MSTSTPHHPATSPKPTSVSMPQPLPSTPLPPMTNESGTNEIKGHQPCSTSNPGSKELTMQPGPLLPGEHISRRDVEKRQHQQEYPEHDQNRQHRFAWRPITRNDLPLRILLDKIRRDKSESFKTLLNIPGAAFQYHEIGVYQPAQIFAEKIP